MSSESIESEHPHEQQLERLRSQVVADYRSAGRFDFTDAEIDAEANRRLAIKLRNDSYQANLPLLDVGQVSAATKRESCKDGREARISVRHRIVGLLEAAGEIGLTREQLSTALGVKEGSVSSPVLYLITHCGAYEPRTRKSSLGRNVAVVVLSDHALKKETAGQQS